jgi:hypothetical protein
VALAVANTAAKAPDTPDKRQLAEKERNVSPGNRLSWPIRVIRSLRAALPLDLVTCVPQVMNVKILSTNGFHRVRPCRHLVEGASPRRLALRAGKTSALGSFLTKIEGCSSSRGIIASSMPTTRRPARDLGGPSSISPVKAAPYGAAGPASAAGSASGPPAACRPHAARKTTKVGSHGRRTGSWLRHRP